MDIYDLGCSAQNFYNSCPLKHEVVNLLMSGEMIYHENSKFFKLEGDL